MKRILIFLLIATGLSTVASAANWVKLGVSMDNKTTAYLDYDSIQRKGDIATIWIKFVHDDKSEGLQHQQIRRDTRQFRFLSSWRYGVVGDVIGHYDYGENEPWTDVPPDSLEEIVYKVLFMP